MKTHNIWTLGTFASGLTVISVVDALLYLFDVLGSTGLYAIAGIGGGITLALLAYIRWLGQTEYVGRKVPSGLSLLSFVSVSSLFVGLEFIILRALNFSATILGPIGLALSVAGAIGFGVLGLIRIYERKSSLEISACQPSKTDDGTKILTVKTKSLGVLSEPEIDWRQLMGAYGEAVQEKPERLRLVVEGGEVNRPVNRIRTLLGHMLSQKEIVTLIYEPSKEIGNFKFEKGVMSGGWQYYTLEANEEAGQESHLKESLRLKHLNHLLRNKDLLRHISTIHLKIPERKSNPELLKVCASLCEYLYKMGYVAKGSGIQFSFEKETVNAERDALDVVDPDRKENSKGLLSEWWKEINNRDPHLPSYLWEEESEEGSDTGSDHDARLSFTEEEKGKPKGFWRRNVEQEVDQTASSPKAVDVLLTLTEKERERMRENLLNRGKKEDEIKAEVNCKEEVFKETRKALQGLPGTKANATQQIGKVRKIRALLLHPDKSITEEELFKQMNLAYEILSNAIDRNQSWAEVKDLEVTGRVSNDKQEEDQRGAEDEERDDWGWTRYGRNRNGYSFIEEIEALETLHDHAFEVFIFSCNIARESSDIVCVVVAYHQAAFGAGLHAKAGEWDLINSKIAEAQLKWPKAEEQSATFLRKMKALEERMGELELAIANVEKKPEVPSGSVMLGWVKRDFAAAKEMLDHVYSCKADLNKLSTQLQEARPIEYAQKALADHTANSNAIENPSTVSMNHTILTAAGMAGATATAASQIIPSDQVVLDAPVVSETGIKNN